MLALDDSVRDRAEPIRVQRVVDHQIIEPAFEFSIAPRVTIVDFPSDRRAPLRVSSGLRGLISLSPFRALDHAVHDCRQSLGGWAGSPYGLGQRALQIGGSFRLRSIGLRIVRGHDTSFSAGPGRLSAKMATRIDTTRDQRDFVLLKYSKDVFGRVSNEILVGD
jgi:hypothetical protein